MDDVSTLPPLTTRRLTIKPLQIEDTSSFHVMTNDDAVIAAVSFLKTPFTLDDAEKMICLNENGRDCFLGIWSAVSGELMGQVGVHLVQENEIEIGYWFGSAFHGQGYASEATKAVVDDIRKKFPHRKLIAECLPENKASWRVLEKAGFHPNGRDGARLGRKQLELKTTP